MTLLVAAALAWVGWVTLAWLPWPAWAASQVPAAAVLLALLWPDHRRRPRPRVVVEPAEPHAAAVEELPAVAPVVDLAAERERRRAA